MAPSDPPLEQGALHHVHEGRRAADVDVRALVAGDVGARALHGEEAVAGVEAVDHLEPLRMARHEVVERGPEDDRGLVAIGVHQGDAARGLS